MTQKYHSFRIEDVCSDAEGEESKILAEARTNNHISMVGERQFGGCPRDVDCNEDAYKCPNDCSCYGYDPCPGDNCHCYYDR